MTLTFTRNILFTTPMKLIVINIALLYDNNNNFSDLTRKHKIDFDRVSGNESHHLAYRRESLIYLFIFLCFIFSHTKLFLYRHLQRNNIYFITSVENVYNVRKNIFNKTSSSTIFTCLSLSTCSMIHQINIDSLLIIERKWKRNFLFILYSWSFVLSFMSMESAFCIVSDVGSSFCSHDKKKTKKTIQKDTFLYYLCCLKKVFFYFSCLTKVFCVFFAA